jgi:hypothetical protein
MSNALHFYHCRVCGRHYLRKDAFGKCKSLSKSAVVALRLTHAPTPGMCDSCFRERSPTTAKVIDAYLR